VAVLPAGLAGSIILALRLLVLVKTQSVLGGSMTVTCSARRIRKTAKLVESLPGLRTPQKAQAALILKDKDNLTWFLSWEDPEVRLEWIKEKLGLGVCSYFSTLLFFPKF
jgi:hypothetical protein